MDIDGLGIDFQGHQLAVAVDGGCDHAAAAAGLDRLFPQIFLHLLHIGLHLFDLAHYIS